MPMNNISLYIHYPFCRSKCPYCDFNSYCNIDIDEEKLIVGYLNELEYYRDVISKRNIETIYFGGGTPSLMGEKLLSEIFSKISSFGNINDDCEITLEANPNSIIFDKLNNFKKIGINRLSIGVQSLYDEELKALGRIHNRNDAIEAIKNAQKIFGDRYTIDLIYTRPNQDLNDWKKELNEAIGLSPYHISLYQLIIEKGTQFYRNKVKLPNDDLSVEFYNVTRDILEDNGIHFYEISNYAKNGYESRHNMVYWTNGEWVGIGAGAHGRINKGLNRYAIQNLKNPVAWLNKCIQKSNGISLKSRLTEEEIVEEFVLMGLRIKNGIKLSDLQKNIKVNTFYEILDRKNIEILSKNGLIFEDKENIKIKNDGFLLLNSIIEKILP